MKIRMPFPLLVKNRNIDLSYNLNSLSYYITQQAALGDGPDGAQKWKVKGGTQQISQLILKDLLGPELSPTTESFPQSFEKRKQKVTVQYWNSTKVIGIDTIDENICQVKCRQNQSSISSNIISCHRIIVALSPTLVLRNIQFNRPLPWRKQCLFDAFSMGMCVKIIVAYTEAFWGHQSSCNHELNHSILPSFYAHNIFSTAIGDYPGLVLLITGDAAKRFSGFDFLTRQDTIFHVKTRNVKTRQETIFYWASTEMSTKFYGYMEGVSIQLILFILIGFNRLILNYYACLQAALSGQRAAQECLQDIYKDKA
jgi:monoamine oxidase